MNQILFNYDYYYKKKLIFDKKKKIYLYIFILTIIIIIVILTYIIYNKYKIQKENLISEKLKEAYQIATMYKNPTSNSQNTSNYSAIQLSNKISIIGLIEIPKINISYPILAESDENLLKISVCRFSRSIAK